MVYSSKIYVKNHFYGYRKQTSGKGVCGECVRNENSKRRGEKKGSKMKLYDRKKTVIAIMGSTAALMLLAGCAGEETQKQTEQEAADITSQSQQNIEEDLSDGLPPDQSEESKQLERPEPPWRPGPLWQSSEYFERQNHFQYSYSGGNVNVRTS